MPSVATMGLRRMRPISSPFSEPAAMAARKAMTSAAQRRSLLPAGYFVRITT